MNSFLKIAKSCVIINMLLLIFYFDKNNVFYSSTSHFFIQILSNKKQAKIAYSTQWVWKSWLKTCCSQDVRTCKKNSEDQELRLRQIAIENYCFILRLLSVTSQEPFDFLATEFQEIPNNYFGSEFLKSPNN